MKILITVLFGVALITSAAQIARAQPRCWGSSLVYIVRDEHGKLISADHDDLWIGPGWEIKDYDFGEGWVGLPESLRKEIGNLRFLAHIEMGEPCSFTKPIELKLTFHGKSMNLVFHAEGKTRLYVDSLPFQTGTFEHQLPRAPREAKNSWPADGWKKTAASAEAVARYPIAFIRGRVLDSANAKPVTNARLTLRSNISYEEAIGNSDVKGVFEMKVRADRFDKVTQLAVVATHPDYLPDFAIAVENRKGDLLQTVNNVTVKMVHAVTISGRVIDEKTGSAPSPKEEITLKAEYPGSKELWQSKIGGETEYLHVKPDGTFSIKTGVGKNRLDLDSYGFCYHLKDEQKELDVSPQGRSGLVLALITSAGCRTFVRVDPKVLDQYVGQYQMPATEYREAFVIKVFRDGDDLYGEYLGRKVEFLPFSDTLFSISEEGVDVRFVRDAQGKISHIDWRGTNVMKIK